MNLLEEKVIDGDDKFKSDMYKIITDAFGFQKNDKAIAETIRRKMEETEHGKWNVIVGNDFGTHVVHTSKKYGYWKWGEQYILIWQSG